MVELCYRGRPVLDSSVLVNAVRSNGIEVDLIPVRTDAPTVMMAFPRLRHRFSDGVVACLTAAVTGPTAVDHGRGLPRDLSQTWGWDRAGAVLAETTHTVVVTELFGRVHAPADRLRFFRHVLEAAIDSTGPTATWWPVSVTALPAVVALERPVAGLVNVRLFRDADRPEYVVMDSLGLQSFGLPDLQCHFRDLEVSRMAGLLQAAAAHVVGGAVLETGHTIQGLSPSDRWRVTLTGSLVEPSRAVFDIDPGVPYRAGAARP